ncbi:MAG TPA: glycosyl hydrolase [Bacteroidia bacterium]|nr:glycosyl hydrolase [Bacteroidia bacterium]
MNRCKLLFAFLLVFQFSFAQKTASGSPDPKPTPAADRLAGLEKRKALADNSIVSNLQFRNVGPAVMSGRVVDIDVNPADPTIFYVAYASGGVWFTDNNGTTFTPVFDNNMLIDIGDIAVNWKDPAKPEIWVGTGECNSSRSSYAGTGIFKSTDGGKTWLNKGLPESHHIGKILIDPTDPKTVYVASIGHLYSPNKERGVFKTTDGGETWKQVLFIDDNTGVIDLFMDPSDPRVIYANAWHRERRAWNFVEGGSKSGIYKTTDGGENWSLITTAASGFPQGEGVGRTGLSIFPGNTNIIYAVVDNQAQDTSVKKDDKLQPSDFRSMTKQQFLSLDRKKLEDYLKRNDFPEKYSADYVTMQVRNGKILPVALADYVSDANSDLFNKPIIGAEVYLSEDGGKTWKKTNTRPLDMMYFTYGYYFGKIWVSPFDKNEVFIGGVTLQKSTDGGKTFAVTEGENQHGDHHALWLDAFRRGHLINGNDGGVNISWDDGKNWFKANTPAVGQFYSVNVDMAKPYNVYGGLQDNGVWSGPSTYQASMEWYSEGRYPYERLLGGDGMQVQVDTRDNNTIYTGFQFGHYFRVDKTTHKETELKINIDLGDQPLRFNWQAPIWLSAHNQDVLYIGAQKVFRSLDQGDHFEAISGDLTLGAKTGDVPYGTISTIHESPVKFGLIYAGSDDGLIHVTKDGGSTWTRISDKLPQHMRVNRVIASSHVEGRVYAVLSGFQWDHFNPYVFVSEDYGANWKQIGTDLPMEPVNVIREDPENENLLFVGTDNGLYVSVNRGSSFMLMNNGIPPVAVHDLVIQPREHDLVVGTHGRSIYIGNISALEQLTDSTLKQDLVLFDPGPIKTHYDYIDTDHEPKLITTNTLDLAMFSNLSGPCTISLLSADGNHTFSMYKDTLEKGLNYFHRDITVDSLYGDSYQSWLDDIGEKEKPVQLPNGSYVLKPGDYIIEVNCGSKTKSVKINIRKPKSRENIPAPSPGEMEWRKD